MVCIMYLKMIIQDLLEGYANAYSDKKCLETFIRMF